LGHGKSGGMQAGADSFKSVTKSFYQQASCVVIAYCKPALAQSTIQDYLLGINEHAHEAARVVIVRTKIDEYPVYNNGLF